MDGWVDGWMLLMLFTICKAILSFNLINTQLRMLSFLPNLPAEGALEME